MINSQGQKGGDSSTNIQANAITINMGIDEKRAREIYYEMNLQLRTEFTQDAMDLANSRVAEFERRLMPKMAAVDGALEAFADPSFQLLIVEAQKTAACTERKADYDLLAELMIHRFQKGENRLARTGINRAVEILDEISDEALLGLTVIHSLASFSPTTGDIHSGLDTLDNLFGKIIYGTLPIEQEWLDHLDILDAVRLNPAGSMRKIDQIYLQLFSGYVDVGIEKKSQNYNKAIEILASHNITKNILVEHALNEDFVRLQIRDVDSIDQLSFQHQIYKNGEIITVFEKISDDKKQALREIYNLYLQDNGIKQSNIILFMSELDKRTNLSILKEWWNNIPMAISITSVGKVLARANAQRCDKNLPDLN